MIRRFARPYAKAMMELAGRPEEADRLHGELVRLESARAGSGELQSLFASPAVDLESKLKVARELVRRLSISDLGLRLVEVLVRHHRMNDLGAVLDAWKEMIHTATGVAVAEVRTAHPLDAKELERLRESLEKKLGRRVEMNVETDPDLLGGFVAQVESRVWDASVLGRVNRFRKQLT